MNKLSFYKKLANCEKIKISGNVKLLYKSELN